MSLLNTEKSYHQIIGDEIKLSILYTDNSTGPHIETSVEIERFYFMNKTITVS